MTRSETPLARTEPATADRHAILAARARATLEANLIVPGERTLPWAPHRGICPSPRTYRGIWNWDSAFHALGVAHWDPVLAREQVRILFDRQAADGSLPDVIYESGEIVARFGKPPVMPWACALLHARAPDADFLDYAYAHSCAFEGFLSRERRASPGLFFYDSPHAPADQRLIEGKYESGWDTSVRWDDGIADLFPIDLNCYMVLLYRALAAMAAALGRAGERASWAGRADALARCVEAHFYSESGGAYFDLRRDTLAPTSVLSPASFMPLFVGSASDDRARTLAMLAGNPDKFFPAMPTVAYDHPAYASSDYWRGPTWLNTAYFALKGLKNYGFTAVAEHGRQTLLKWCADNPDHLYEYYDSRTGKGLGAPQFGWTAAFILEFVHHW